MVAMPAGVATSAADLLSPAAAWTAGILVAASMLAAYLTRRARQAPGRLIHAGSIGVLVAVVAVVVVAVWVRDVWVWRTTGVWVGPSAGIIGYMIWRAWRDRAR